MEPITLTWARDFSIPGSLLAPAALTEVGLLSLLRAESPQQTQQSYPNNGNSHITNNSLLVPGSPVLLLHRPVCLPPLHNRDVRHSLVAGSSMPVPRPGRDRNRVTCRNHALLCLGCHDTVPLDDMQYLVLLVNMWYGAPPGTKVHIEQIKLAAFCRTHQALYVHLTREVVAARRIVLCLGMVYPGDLHNYPSISIGDPHLQSSLPLPGRREPPTSAALPPPGRASRLRKSSRR